MTNTLGGYILKSEKNTPGGYLSGRLEVPMREEKYDISGMHCAACSASVERVTRKLPGVERSEVNLTTGIMTIAYDESQCTQEQIIALSLIHISEPTRPY